MSTAQGRGDNAGPPTEGVGTVHRFVAGESILRLFEPAAAPANTSPNESFLASTGFRYLTLAAHNLHEIVDACREFGVNVPREPAEIRAGVFMCQIQDPDGNWIEIMQSS